MLRQQGGVSISPKKEENEPRFSLHLVQSPRPISYISGSIFPAVLGSVPLDISLFLILFLLLLLLLLLPNHAFTAGRSNQTELVPDVGLGKSGEGAGKYRNVSVWLCALCLGICLVFKCSPNSEKL
jgi:hypothetical protein